MKNKLVIPVAVLCLLLSVLLCIKHVNKEEPDDNIIREATEEEIIIEEQQENETTPEVIEEPEIQEPIEEPELVPEEQEPEIELTPQEQARVELVEKYGEDVVDAWEKLSRDDFFDYIGYKLIVHEEYGPEGNIYYHCYKILEDGSSEDACVGGNYYIYGVFVSDVAIFDLVDYHNEFFAVK